VSYFGVKVKDWVKKISQFRESGVQNFQVIQNCIDMGRANYNEFGVSFTFDDSNIILSYGDLTYHFKLDILGNISLNDEEIEHSRCKDLALASIDIVAQKVAETMLRDVFVRNTRRDTTAIEGNNS
jgi:hypothetical protein